MAILEVHAYSLLAFRLFCVQKLFTGVVFFLSNHESWALINDILGKATETLGPNNCTHSESIYNICILVRIST